jgi:hypothetical protein
MTPYNIFLCNVIRLGTLSPIRRRSNILWKDSNLSKPNALVEQQLPSNATMVIQESDGPLIETLPITYQIILRAKGSYAKMAADLGMPIGTVRSRLHRARKALLEGREQHNRNTKSGL